LCLVFREFCGVNRIAMSLMATYLRKKNCSVKKNDFSQWCL
jgi:hypothetical protein